MVDNVEAKTDEETHAIPAAGRVAAEAASTSMVRRVGKCATLSSPPNASPRKKKATRSQTRK